MKIHIGKSLDNPIILKRVELDRNTETFIVENDSTLSNKYKSISKLHNYIDYLFGSDDGDWFLLGENTCIINDFRYTIFNIEDKDGEKHLIHFKIT